MYHLHTLRLMSYVYLQIFLTRQGNTLTIEAPFLWSGCGRVVQGAGHKAKRLVLQCINGVSSNPVEGRTKIWQLKNLILTLFGLIFRRIYIYIYNVYIKYQKSFIIFTMNFFLLPLLVLKITQLQDKYIYIVISVVNKSPSTMCSFFMNVLSQALEKRNIPVFVHFVDLFYCYFST